MPTFDLGRVVGPQGPQGATGPQGPQGVQGAAALINGVNALNIIAGENIELDQSGSTLTVSAPRQYGRNLLDNWYFVGGGSQLGGGQFPINQRGQTSYSNTKSGYGIDRWQDTYNQITVTLENDGLVLTSSIDGSIFTQTIDGNALQPGDICTCSVILDNQLYTITYTLSESEGWYGTLVLGEKYYHQYHIDAQGRYTFCIIKAWNATQQSAKIKAVKLELGDTQTLAHQENGVWVLNEIPDYGEELLKCQRYFCRVNVPTYARVGYGMGENAEALALTIPLPNLMRCTPTMTFSEGDWRIISPDGNTYYVDSMSSSALGESVGLEAQILVYCSMAVPPQFVRLRNLSIYTQYLDFSADL